VEKLKVIFYLLYVGRIFRKTKNLSAIVLRKSRKSGKYREFIDKKLFKMKYLSHLFTYRRVRYNFSENKSYISHSQQSSPSFQVNPISF
jgi:hypothetical protein